MKSVLRVAAAAAILVACSTNVNAQPAVGPRVGGMLEYRLAQKEAANALGSRAAGRDFLGKRALSVRSLDTEDIAIYVDRQLTGSEIAELEKNGVDVVDWIYVPAIPGKHPHGFHLATMENDALPALLADKRIVFVDTAEMQSEPQNDLSRTMIQADLVQAGTGLSQAYDGTGINIAVADSSLDINHPDFPTPVEAYDVTDGSDVGSWDTDVSSTASDHGTHVTGTVLGRGTNSAGKYAGGAPGANLYFYKIGNDTTAGASSTDEIEALERAAVVGCDIFSMSYGGYSTYMDGSSSMSQAIDDATLNDNMLVFISAGNAANDNRHYARSVAPGATSPGFSFTINNPSSTEVYDNDVWLQLVWVDDNAGDFNLDVNVSGLGGGESVSDVFTGSSSRGTETRYVAITPNIAANGSRTYTLQLVNSAGSGTTPLVHVYSSSTGNGTFDAADDTYTVSNPALADEAIAVAAWVHRTTWINYQGSTFGYSSSYQYGNRAPFSSIGPRVDGTMKPNIAAPGALTISTRDSDQSFTTTYRIDNDGINNGLGPADYVGKQGTSMACPMAAGGAALLLRALRENGATLTATEIKSIIFSNADSSYRQLDNESGNGLMDIYAAVQEAETSLLGARQWMYFQ